MGRQWRAMDDARDDSVPPAMRVAAVVVVAVLVPALIILWGLPTRTDDLWAWTITAPLTPIFMGAGYGAGAYFFLRVFRTPRWHEVSVGVISAAVFALLMLITTILHYDKFNQGKAHDGLPDPPRSRRSPSTAGRSSTSCRRSSSAGCGGATSSSTRARPTPASRSCRRTCGSWRA